MSSNSGETQDGGEQPKITDYVSYECSVCGRTYDEDGTVCHPPEITQFERRLAECKILLPSKRSPDRTSTKHLVLGSDHVNFECLYATLLPLLEHQAEAFEAYLAETPYQIPTLELAKNVYQRHLEHSYEKWEIGLLAALRACEDRVERLGDDVTHADVFAHLVYLDQYGLIPGYRRLQDTGGVREFYSDFYDVETKELNSEWLVERPVDRAKVFSTTERFRRVWNLELVGNISNSNPKADYKPFDRTAVLGDHRDHNLVTRRAKQELLGLPYVDWVTAPHQFYLPGTEESAPETSSAVGFDFAGFEYGTDNQKLRYLGIVTEHEENPVDIYLQVKQLRKTHANGIIIMPNRDTIYDFLHFLKTEEIVSGTEFLMDSRDRYSSIPNVRLLHEKVNDEIELLNKVALMPRRKFLDEGFQNIDNLIPVTTYG